MRWGIGRLERKYLAGELGPGEELLTWSFVMPEAHSTLHAYALQREDPIGVVSDRALFLLMPRQREQVRLPFNLMDDLRVRYSIRLEIVVDADRTIVWDLKDRAFGDTALRSFTAYQQKAFDVWPDSEPHDFVPQVENLYRERLAAGDMPHAAEALVLGHVASMIAEQSHSKQVTHAARTRAADVVRALVAAEPQPHTGHSRQDLAGTSGDDVALLEAHRAFAHLYTQIAHLANGEWLFRGGRLVDAVERYYEPTLRDCLTEPAFAEAFADAQQVVATRAPGLDTYIKQVVIDELRKGTYPSNLNLTSADVWNGYVQAAAAARNGTDGSLRDVAGLTG